MNRHFRRLRAIFLLKMSWNQNIFHNIIHYVWCNCGRVTVYPLRLLQILLVGFTADIIEYPQSICKTEKYSTRWYNEYMACCAYILIRDKNPTAKNPKYVSVDIFNTAYQYKNTSSTSLHSKMWYHIINLDHQVLLKGCCYFHWVITLLPACTYTGYSVV